MANTEKPTTKAEAKRQQIAGTSKKSNKENTPKKAVKNTSKKEIIEDIKETGKVSEENAKAEEKIAEEIAEKTSKKETKTSEAETEKKEVSEDKTKTEETKKESSKKQVQKAKVKKEEAIVNGYSLPISTKDAIAICRFIKYKKIERAIEELEDVLKMRRPVPIKGEIPHRKGPGKIASGSGRFPLKASNYFIKLLGTLKANSENNGLENPVIAIAQANIASRPVARFGRARKKRSHIQIIAKERNKLRQEKNKQKK